MLRDVDSTIWGRVLRDTLESVRRGGIQEEGMGEWGKGGRERGRVPKKMNGFEE